MTTQTTLPEIAVHTKVSDQDKELMTSAQGILNAYEKRVVETPQDYETIAAEMMSIKGRARRLEEVRVSITKPINDGLKAINKLFGDPIELYEKCERIIKNKMVAFNNEQERLRKEEEARLQKEQEIAAQKEKDRLDKLAEKQMTAGNFDKAEETLQRKEEVAVAPVTIAKQTVNVSGIQMRKVWKARVKDWNVIPVSQLTATDKQKEATQAHLNALAKASKGSIPVAGVEFYEEQDIASGSR